MEVNNKNTNKTTILVQVENAKSTRPVLEGRRYMSSFLSYV